MNCRHCGCPLEHVFLDLGFAPPSNAYLSQQDLNAPETWYPLKLFVCNTCWLVQTEDYARADELFRSDYAYFSSTSTTWLEHARRYAEDIRQRLSLDQTSFVVEIASNDGYLLKHFVAAGIPCLGIEPTEGTARAAEAQGIPVWETFFDLPKALEWVADRPQADLIVGNNVYAHVPDINGFTAGLKALLKAGGTITLEFPHVMQLLHLTQFDTVYHEHYSYLSLYTVQRIFAQHGLRIQDVEQLATHGGSLRVYGCHTDDARATAPGVGALLAQEQARGMRELSTYQGFQARAEKTRLALFDFLVDQRRRGKKVAAYGAAAKGNTLLNFAGIGPDLVSVVFDAAPSKQGKYLPGSHIPILPPAAIPALRPDYILILPWNIASEIMDALACVEEWQGEFAIAVPQLLVGAAGIRPFAS